MLRPKRRRWVNEKYTRWVKTQPCCMLMENLLMIPTT